MSRMFPLTWKNDLIEKVKGGKEAKTVSAVSKKWKYLVYYVRKQTGVIAVGYILGKLNYLVIFFK